MLTMSFVKRSLICLILTLLTHVVYAASVNDQFTHFTIDDFIISLPKDFIQKTEQTIEFGKPMNAYLFEPAVYAKSSDTPLTKHLTSKTPFLFLMVVPLPRELKSNEIVNAQRMYIAMLNAATRQAYGFKVEQNDFINVHLYAKEIDLNDRKIQTYTFNVYQGTMAYYTFIENNKLYAFQTLFIYEKSQLLNENIVKRALRTLTIKPTSP